MGRFKAANLFDGSNDPLPPLWAAILVPLLAAGACLGLATLQWPGLAGIAAVQLLVLLYGLRTGNWPSSRSEAEQLEDRADQALARTP
jgi:hypothetical protein